MAKKKGPAPSASGLQMMWEYISGIYEFVRNTVTRQIMWRPAEDKKGPYNEMTDEKLNSIVIDLNYAGFRSASAETLRMFLYSDYTPEYHPIKSYLDKLPSKRGSAIQKLADTVTTTNKEMWEKFLRIYLIACVANIYRPERNTNDFCLTFTGPMGKGKSTWQQYLCPPVLSDYIYVGELDLQNKKDTIWMLTRYWFIIIEEQIKALNRKDENTMKQLISLPFVKGRKHFARFDSHGIRIANFGAGSNDKDLITDAMSSRRYLIFEAVEFKLDALKKININDVWAEAMTLYNDGEKFWIEGSEIEQLREYNKRFSWVTDEMEYVMQYLSRPADEKEVTHYLPSTVIRDYLQIETNCKTLRERYIGNAMNKLNFIQKSVRVDAKKFPIWGWAVNLETDNLVVNRYSKDKLLHD